jgi:hypothetical protein
MDHIIAVSQSVLDTLDQKILDDLVGNRMDMIIEIGRMGHISKQTSLNDLMTVQALLDMHRAPDVIFIDMFINGCQGFKHMTVREFLKTYMYTINDVLHMRIVKE